MTRQPADAPQRVGDDGLLQPPERPRWIDRADDWMTRHMAKPPPRWRVRLDQLEDRLPVWALPIVVTGGMALFAFFVLYVGPRLVEWFEAVA